jgi:SAM-dependent MidA family methyltransferase
LSGEPHLLPPSITAALAAAGGRVTFARFMDLALTDTESGYYARADRLLGRHGHFTTAPHRVPAFNRAMSAMLAELADILLTSTGAERVTVIEVGGGEGDLAAGVLERWQEARPDLKGRVDYLLVELGEGLRRAQQERLVGAIGQGWQVGWATDLGACEPVTGILVSNELVDALPVHVVDVSGPRLRESWVTLDHVPAGPEDGGRATGASAHEEWDDASPDALQELLRVFGTVKATLLRPLTRDGLLELRPAARGFLEQAARVLVDGAVLTIDYGDWLPGTESAEPEAPTRIPLGPGGPALHGRTLRTYFHHQRGADPLSLVGHQDLTADVDFRALHRHGLDLGLSTVSYCLLGELLAANGAAEDLAGLRPAVDRSLDADIEASALDALLDGGGLGGLFKAMLQVK